MKDLRGEKTSHRPFRSGVLVRFTSVTAFLAAILLLIFAATSPLASKSETGDSDVERARTAARLETGASGLPLPRFVSLRASEVNMRAGPGMRYPIEWVYRRPGLPVEVIDEHETWRRIRDRDGAEGWVHQSMIEGRRMIQVVGEDMLLLRREPSDSAPGIAWVEPGVVARLGSCEDAWCRLDVSGLSGWLPRAALWGVYPSESLH